MSAGEEKSEAQLAYEQGLAHRDELAPSLAREPVRDVIWTALEEWTYTLAGISEDRIRGSEKQIAQWICGWLSACGVDLDAADRRG